VAELRALTLFEDVPASCKAVQVLQSGFEPHLRLGECAIVDTADKGLQYGELYMLWMGTRDPHLAIVQPYDSSVFKVGIMYRFALHRPGRMVMADGPLNPQFWPEKCLGRIVGLFQPLRTEIVSAADAYVQRLDGSFAPPPKRPAS
jgi:hypothetical protein